MPGLAEAIDPLTESAYRRGYRHGARELLKAIENQLAPEQATELRAYIEFTLAKWDQGNEFQPPPVPTFDAVSR